MKEKFITRIKFIIITIVFYLLLAFNVFHIGEFLIPMDKDYLNDSEIQTDQNSEDIYLGANENIQTQTEHFSANDKIRLQSLCDNSVLCEKIEFNGSFNDRDKYFYTESISKIIGFIDENSNEDRQIEEVINTIKINKEYGNRRGYATRDSIIFNIGSVQSKKEFIGLSTHEMGHITDLGYIQGSSYKKDKNFTEFGKAVFASDDPSLNFYRISRDKEKIRKAEAKKKDFCSGYGMSDPFEDFAECFNLYTNHNSLFKQIGRTNPILKKKYNTIASIFNGKYILSSNQDLLLIKNNITRRPRDTTKLVTN